MKARNQYELAVCFLEEPEYNGYFWFAPLPTQDPFFTFCLLCALSSVIPASIISRVPSWLASTNWRLTCLTGDWEQEERERSEAFFLPAPSLCQCCIFPTTDPLIVTELHPPPTPSAPGLCGVERNIPTALYC